MSKIIKLTDREHILHRPSMYIGGVSPDEVTDYYLNDDKLSIQTLSYPPGLVKIINEVIDNAIDVIVKSKEGNKVGVSITNDSVTVTDDSSGFPIASTGEQPIVLALGNARAGSNFEDSDNVGQMGTNGVGAFATNCFSTEFLAQSYKGTHSITAKWTDNASNVDVKVSRVSKRTGTTISFKPDLKRFNMDEISDDIIKVIKTRLICLAYTYDIKFTFNDAPIIKPKNITDLLDINDCPMIHYKTDNYEVHVIARNETTQNFSFVNGLNIKDGGTHLDVMSNDLAKAFMSTRGINANKSDILNTLQLVFVGSRFKNLRFNSQTKEKITNSTAEVRSYLGNIEPFIQKVLKSKDIKEFIKATSQARELRQNKTQLNKVKKSRIKSDKFLDAQKERKYLMLVEGESALGGLLPSMGREFIAYYTLKGKPLNAWSASTQKMTANVELSELLSIVHQSNFEKVIFGTDQDLDGFHIRGLLLGFFIKYLPEYTDKIYFLQTPVRGVTKNDNLIRWSYNLSEDLQYIKASEHPQYYKGLGSWDKEDLKKVIEVDGLDKMLCKVDINLEDQSILESWLGVNSSQDRKDFILENDFNIAKI